MVFIKAGLPMQTGFVFTATAAVINNLQDPDPSSTHTRTPCSSHY